MRSVLKYNELWNVVDKRIIMFLNNLFEKIIKQKQLNDETIHIKIIGGFIE